MFTHIKTELKWLKDKKLDQVKNFLSQLFSYLCMDYQNGFLLHFPSRTFDT